MIKPTDNKYYQRGQELLSGMQLATLQDMQRAFAIAKTDYDVAAVCSYLRAETSGESLQHFDAVWSELAPFYDVTDDRTLRFFARSKLRRDAYDAFYQKYSDRDLTGIQLLNQSKTQGAVFLPDASEQGRFRVSYFDAHGFFGHFTADSYSCLLRDVWESGYKEEGNPIQEWSLKPEWTKGSEITLLMQQLNSGQLKFVEFTDQSTLLALKHKIADLLVLNNGECPHRVFVEISEMLNTHGFHSNTLTLELIKLMPNSVVDQIAQGLDKVEPDLKKASTVDINEYQPVTTPSDRAFS